MSSGFEKGRYFRKQIVKGLMYSQDPTGNSALRVGSTTFTKDRVDRTRSGKSEFLLPGSVNTFLGDEAGTGGITKKIPFPLNMIIGVREIPDVLGLVFIIPAVVGGVSIFKDNY